MSKGHFHFKFSTNLILVIFLSSRLEVAQVCVLISHSSLWTPLRHVYRVSRASTRPGDSGASTPVSLLLLWDLSQTVRFMVLFNCLKKGIWLQWFVVQSVNKLFVFGFSCCVLRDVWKHQDSALWLFLSRHGSSRAHARGITWRDRMCNLFSAKLYFSHFYYMWT